jgi:hypothetical protein
VINARSPVPARLVRAVVLTVLAFAAMLLAAPARAGVDVDKNGTINVSDIQRAVNIILGSTPNYTGEGDSNCGGSVNVSDVQNIVNVILGTAVGHKRCTLTAGTANNAYSDTLTAAGGTGPYTYQVMSGSVPGLTVAAGGAISGTPTTAGTYVLSVKVTDSSATPKTATNNLTIVISVANGIAPAITSTAVTSATANTAYSYLVTATGTPTPTISASGLPTWLTFSANTLSGTPTIVDGGVTGTITVTASNGVGTNAVQTFQITVNSGGTTPAILSSAPTTATQGTAYTYTVICTGTPPPTVSVSNKPAWLTLTNKTLSGTPAAGDVGVTPTITITASNGNLPNATQNFTITVASNAIAPTITSTPPATATLFSTYTYTLAGTGTPALTAGSYSVSGNPPWLTLSGGVLSGTPGIFHAGTTGTITITANNGVAPNATQSFTITVSAPEHPDAAPEVTFEYPPTDFSGNGAIARNSKMVICFSEPMDVGTNSISINATGTAASVLVAGTSSFTYQNTTTAMASGFNNRILVVNAPAAGFGTNAAVIFCMFCSRPTVANTPGFRDVDGNQLLNNHNDAGLNGFTVGAVTDPAVGFQWASTLADDLTAPTKTSAPAASSTGNAATSPIVVTWNEPINPATLAAGFTVSDTSGSVPGSISINHADLKTVTFTPSRALAGAVSVTLATVQDLCGNAAGAGANFTFTVGTDVTVPVISRLTLNFVPSHLNGSAANGGASPGGGILQVPTSGFVISMYYSDAGSGVSQTLSNFSIKASVAAGGNAASTNLAPLWTTGNYDIRADQAHFVVPASLAFATGACTLTVAVKDAAATPNTSANSTFKMTVLTATSAMTPLEGNPDTWMLYFDRDHETTTYNFAGNTVSSASTDTVSADSSPDFVQDLMGYGFWDNGASTGNVTGGGLTMRQAAKNFIINRLIYHMYRHQGMYVPIMDGKLNPGFNAILTTTSPTTALFSPNMRFSYATTTPLSTDNRIAFGGTCQALILGRASFDLKNATRNEDNGTGVSTNTNLGIFTQFYVRDNWGGTPPDTSSIYFQLFDETTPFAGGSRKTPVGADATNDATILDPNQNPANFSGTRLTRYQRVLRALDAFAQLWAPTAVHEIGHSTGLVGDGAPGTGLYGGLSGVFTGSTSAHINLDPYFIGSGQEIMSVSSAIYHPLSRYTQFNELLFAYLLGLELEN